MFECLRCCRRFERRGFESTGTFYTLCEECGDEVMGEKKKGKKGKENAKKGEGRKTSYNPLEKEGKSFIKPLSWLLSKKTPNHVI